MCGIVGIMTVNTANDKQLKALSHLLLLDQMRGEHATGLAKVNLKTGVATVHKMAGNAIDYLADAETKKFLMQDRQGLYIGHNRFATMGSRDASGAHPFQHKHITMVHNGVVDRWVQNDLEGYSDVDCTVDSDMVCRTIATKGIEATAKLLSGAFSLVWWNAQDRTLNFLRNTLRPMFICHTEDETMWASEKNFLNVLLARKDKCVAEYEPYEIKPHTLYSWHYDEAGKLLFKGHAKVRPLQINDIADPFIGTRGNYGSNNTGVYGTEGYYGVQQANTRLNNKLKSVGLLHKIGDRVKVIVSKASRSALYDNKVDLYGTLPGPEGVKVAFRTFQTPLQNLMEPIDPEALKLLPVGCTNAADFCKGFPQEVYCEIDNCYQVTERNPLTNLMESFERVVMSNVKTVALEAAGALSKKPEGTKNVEGASKFPLKVDGWTFSTAQEFLNLTSTGCSCCGNIPTVFSRANKDMCVYSGVGAGRASIMDAEFMCGECMNMDSKPGNVLT